ncbi:MAG: DUF4926 domain-containing protein [Thermoleophilia bacterium]
MGTIVESLAPDVFEVGFSDKEGRTYATLGWRVKPIDDSSSLTCQSCFDASRSLEALPVLMS